MDPENPMVIDDLWTALDELEQQIIDEEEEFYERADLEYEMERERDMMRECFL